MVWDCEVDEVCEEGCLSDLLFEKKQKVMFFFFSKRSEPKKNLLSLNTFLHIKGLNLKSQKPTI